MNSEAEFDLLADKTIELAERRFRALEKELNALNHRKHPTPTRYQQRKRTNFLTEKFNEETTPEDFMACFSFFGNTGGQNCAYSRLYSNVRRTQLSLYYQKYFLAYANVGIRYMARAYLFYLCCASFIF